MPGQFAAFVVLLFSRERYLKRARDRFAEFDPSLKPQQLDDLEPNNDVWRMSLRSDLLKAFWGTSLMLGLACLFAYLTGRWDVGMPVAWSKVANAAGAFLTAWPTWFMLGHVEDTWDMDGRLDVALRPYIFKILFMPGLMLTLFGAIW